MMTANTGHIMTVANSIIGVGILAMPFCFQKCGIILSILLLIINNIITRICCHYLIKSSMLTRRKSFEFLAFHAFGSSGKLMVELCIIGYLIGTCIAYFVVVGDVGPQIVAKVLNIAEGDRLRTWVMVVVTALCIIPLAMLKNVDSLATVCTASIGFYICLVMKVIAESKTHILANDWSDRVEYWKPSGTLQCLPIFSMALSCQMQLFEVFETVSNASLEKMNQIVKTATMLCMCVYIFVGFFGYVAFCNQSFAGNILINFSPSVASDVIKIGFVLSVAFSFPLVIFPCRASIYSLLYRRGHTDSTGYIPELRFKIITVSIVLFSLSIALLIPSIELVIGLVGSTIGVAICVMFPASCFIKVSKKDSTEKRMAQFILIGGFCLMILGTYANLMAIDEKRSGSSSVVEDDKAIEKITNLENLSENLKPTELHQAEKPIEVKLPKLSIEDKNININPNLDMSREKTKEIKLEPVKVDTFINEAQSTSKSETKSGPPVGIENSPLGVNQNNSDINKDAIKKEEDIAAEEAQKQEREINKAKAELEESNKLLVRKVDELKLEIKKQNEETKSLVAEKLEDIVEKVEKIEREVHKETKEKLMTGDVNKPATLNEKEKSINEEQQDATKLLAKDNNTMTRDDKKVVSPMPKGFLINMLTDNLKERKKFHETNNTVFEPMSYKTGEIINKIQNNKLNESMSPLPLPLLINAAIPKSRDEKSAPHDNFDKDKASKPTEKIIHDINIAKIPDRNNIESIRRDILQANTKNEISTASSLIVENFKREKRNIAKDLCVNWDAMLNECLDQKTINSIVPQNMANIKVESIGRDLKSVQEKT